MWGFVSWNDFQHVINVCLFLILANVEYFELVNIKWASSNIGRPTQNDLVAKNETNTNVVLVVILSLQTTMCEEYKCKPS